MQKTAALIDHLEQTATRVMILVVVGEMLGEVFDARREQGDLYFRRAGIVGGAAVISNDFAGLFDRERHDVSLMLRPARFGPLAQRVSRHNPR